MLANSPALDNFWMPFTANRQFKAAPRMLAAAAGMNYTTTDGRTVLDGTPDFGASTQAMVASASRARSNGS
jgi:adenosylmethionine-8-amino-7-oxononanoate aminotransferase